MLVTLFASLMVLMPMVNLSVSPWSLLHPPPNLAIPLTLLNVQAVPSLIASRSVAAARAHNRAHVVVVTGPTTLIGTCQASAAIRGSVAHHFHRAVATTADVAPGGQVSEAVGEAVEEILMGKSLSKAVQ
jgi:hypothetical protein